MMLSSTPSYHENFLGLSSIERIQNADILSNILADTYFLFLKTQDCNWNVRGALFRELHLLFEEQYKELFEAIDEIAERIRALGEATPGTFREFSERTEIKERKGHSSAQDMLRDMSVSTQILISRLRDCLRKVDVTDDMVTHDLLIRRLAVHEKNLWILQSFVE